MNEEREHQKRCLYRLWWPKRSDRTLISKKTHSERFGEMYGQTLEEYHKELAERNLKAKHEAAVRFYKSVGGHDA